MKIRILGSGGGERFPAVFCNCEHCETARLAGGKSIRTLSQTLINDDLLIDFPEDTACHAQKYGIRLGNIENILITHTHYDHCAPLTFFTRGGVQAHNMFYEKLHLYGPQNLDSLFDTMFSMYSIAKPIRDNIEIEAFADNERKKIGKYEVTAFRAIHSEPYTVNYLIDDGEKKLLYFIDSGYPTSKTLAFLESLLLSADGVIMDGTFGYAPARTSATHMSFEDNKQLKTELITRGIVKKDAKCIVTHITHNKAETHEKTEEIFAGTDIIVAYDGMEVEL